MRYFAFIILILSFTSCDKKIIDNLGSDLPLNKEFVIENGSTKNNLEENISLQMVSVVNDSRCPSDVECVWEGDAEVNLVFNSALGIHPIILHTNLASKDTTIGTFTISLIKLDPYPISTKVISQSEYKATIFVTKHD